MLNHSSENKREVYTVSRFNTEVKQLLRAEIEPLWIEGEISNLSRPASGHIYFLLKDDKAQIRCVMFKSKAASLDFELENGIQVTVHARADLYEERGSFQLIVSLMEISGQGELHQRFERLKRKLVREGLFDPERKRMIPKIPRRVGVITSKDGAALHDVLTTLAQRLPTIEVFVYPTLVQGSEASGTICHMLEIANTRCEVDVLILARGGGSLEDLWAFNEEPVARAIAASSLPVITGIGHDIDLTIADLAADHYAPTPTAAAQHASPDRHTLNQNLTERHRHLDNLLTNRLDTAKQKLMVMQAHLLRWHPETRIEQWMQKLDDARERLLTNLRILIGHASQNLTLSQMALAHHTPLGRLRIVRTRSTSAATALNLAMKHALENHRHQLEQLARCLDVLSPLATLKRGYSITTDEHGRIVRSLEALTPEQKISIRIEDGRIEAAVEKLLKSDG